MPHVKIEIVSSKKSDSLTLPFDTDAALNRFLISLADAAALNIILQLAEMEEASKPAHDDVPIDVIILGFESLTKED